jgi:hypothetical protein
MKVGFSMYIESELLSNVEANVKGRNRSEKLEKCISEGYKHLTSCKDSTTAPHGEVQAKPA